MKPVLHCLPSAHKIACFNKKCFKCQNVFCSENQVATDEQGANQVVPTDVGNFEAVDLPGQNIIFFFLNLSLPAACTQNYTCSLTRFWTSFG